MDIIHLRYTVELCLLGLSVLFWFTCGFLWTARGRSRRTKEIAFRLYGVINLAVWVTWLLIDRKDIWVPVCTTVIVTAVTLAPSYGAFLLFRAERHQNVWKRLKQWIQND